MNSDYTPKINLLDYKDSERREGRERRRGILLGLLVIVLVLAAAAGTEYYQRSRLAVLAQQNQELTLERQQLAAQSAPAGRVYVGGAERQQLLDKLLEQRISYVEPLKNLYWQARPDIYLNRVTVNDKELNINGYVQGQEDFIDFSRRMLKAPGVQALKSVDTQLNEKCGEVTFNLVLRWEVKP